MGLPYNEYFDKWLSYHKRIEDLINVPLNLFTPDREAEVVRLSIKLDDLEHRIKKECWKDFRERLSIEAVRDKLIYQCDLETKLFTIYEVEGGIYIETYTVCCVDGKPDEKIAVRDM